jgi:hypothetical protein
VRDAIALGEAISAAKLRRNTRGEAAASAQKSGEKKKPFSLPRGVGVSAPRMHENHARRMTNVEVRMTKECRSPNDELPLGVSKPISSFVMGASLVIRH